MTSILGKIFNGHASPPPIPGRGDVAYARAMADSGEVIRRMREHSSSTDAARALMADIWAQNRNMPFLTTVYESVQEAKTGPDTVQEAQQHDRVPRSR